LLFFSNLSKESGLRVWNKKALARSTIRTIFIPSSLFCFKNQMRKMSRFPKKDWKIFKLKKFGLRRAVFMRSIILRTMSANNTRAV